MAPKKGQKSGFEKSYFKGANMKDTSIYIKFPKHSESKNLSRKVKKKKLN